MKHAATILLLLFLLPVLAKAQPDCTWQPDVNADGEIGTTDLLGLLSAFGPWTRATCPEAWMQDIPESDACNGQTFARYEGHRYPLVSIGNQCWFAENLRTTTYGNGQRILAGLNSGEWLGASEGAMSVYAEEEESRVYSGNPDATTNLDQFGRLYNWFAVDDWRSLCPAGWAVPSLEDWKKLAQSLGGEEMAGALLKMEQIGFQARLGGGRNYGGFYGSADKAGLWWTATSVGNLAWYVRVDADSPSLSWQKTNPKMGAAIRCIQVQAKPPRH